MTIFRKIAVVGGILVGCFLCGVDVATRIRWDPRLDPTRIWSEETVFWGTTMAAMILFAAGVGFICVVAHFAALDYAKKFGGE
jgi:hypothetical protein